MEISHEITRILAKLALAMVKPARGLMDPPAPVFAAAAAAALDLVRADGVSVSRIEPENGRVRTLFNGGIFLENSPPFPEDEVYFIRDYPDLVTLLEWGRPWAKAFPDPADPDPEAVLLREVRQSAAAAVAIEVDGRTWGELYVSRTEAVGFSAVEVASLQVLAAHIGSLIALQARVEEVAASSQVDALTGLALRGVAERAMAAERDSVTVAILDVDGLKRVNDRFGHAAGDRLLQTVAAELTAMKQHLPQATVARLGGDEFLVVMPGEDIADCLPHLQSVISTISKIPGTGISCGIATTTDLRADFGTGRPLLRLADAALYRAKQTKASMPLRSRQLGSAGPAPLDRFPIRWNCRQVPAHCQASARLADLVEEVTLFAAEINAAAWWISQVSPGSTEFEVCCRMITRDRRQEDGRDISPVGDRYPVSDYPWSQEALAGGSLWVGLNDVDSDPGEQATIAEIGYSGNLVVGFTDCQGMAWLSEIFTDAESSSPGHRGRELLGRIVARGCPAVLTDTAKR